MSEIKSASNPKFKYFKSLLDKKGRSRAGEYTVDGVKSVRDAILADCDVTAVLAVEKQLDNIPAEYKGEVYILADFLMEKLSDTKSPQGMMAVIRKNPMLCPDTRKDGLYVYCDGISDPGNLGTIIRTADAAGFDGVLLSEGSVDVYNPKTVRSCMGSFFHVPIYENVSPEFLKDFDGSVYGGILSGETVDYREPCYGRKTVIVIGNEANGISDRVKELCIPVKIPVYGRAESLNAAVAGAIMMYEVSNRIK